MREVYKEYAGDSGPNWILDLEGPDGDVYNLWGIHITIRTFKV